MALFAGGIGGVDGYELAAVNYHKALLIEKELVEGKAHYAVSTEARDIPDNVIIKRLTWEGRDFIDGIRTDTKWNKVKGYLADAGKDLTMETIKVAVKTLFGFG